MSDKAFRDAKGDLAFSQALREKLMPPPQMVQAGMPQEQGVPTQEIPQEAPKQAPQAPTKEPEESPAQEAKENESPEEEASGNLSPVDFLANATKKMTDSFADITKFFMSNDEKQKEETKKREEKIIKEMKDIKGKIREIVEE